MKPDVYSIILFVPPLLVTYIPILVFPVMKVFYRRRFDQISRWVATNAFSNILKEKKKRIVVLEKRGGCLKTLI